MTNYPPTALETETCPPHHWVIDRSNVGTCKKCGLVKEFSSRAPSLYEGRASQARASAGGKKNKGKPSKRKGRSKYNANL